MRDFPIVFARVTPSNKLKIVKVRPRSHARICAFDQLTEMHA